MKASELRIGNILEFSNGIQPSKTVRVGRRFFSSAAIEKEDNDFEITHYYRPIPLTEEWLLKAGFEAKSKKWSDGSITDNAYFKKNYIITYDCHGKYFIISSVICGNLHFICTFEYVHQLQNLYFALTGEELTFNI